MTSGAWRGPLRGVGLLLAAVARPLPAAGARNASQPGEPDTRFPSEATDLRRDPGSRAVDAGVRLPDFDDDFTGRAPDLGCCELGRPLAHYGPRP